MITYNVDRVKMPKIKKRDTSAWIRKVAAYKYFSYYRNEKYCRNKKLR